MRTRRVRSGALALFALATVVAACSGSSGSSPSPAASLTANPWQLSAVTVKAPAFQGVVPADQQASYTITFKADGSAEIKADCNQVSATYTSTPEGGLTIDLGGSTLVACPEGSLSDQYLAGLANASRYAISGSDLKITGKNDEGTLEFVAAK